MTRSSPGRAALAAAALAPVAAFAAVLAEAFARALFAAPGALRRGLLDNALSLALCALPVAAVLVVAAPAGVALGAWFARASGGVARRVERALDALGGVPPGLLGGALGALALSGSGPRALAVWLALVAVVLPGLAARAAAAFGRVSRDRYEAALALGATRAQAFTQVTLAGVWRPLAGALLRAAARVAAESVVLVIAAAATREGYVRTVSGAPPQLWMLWPAVGPHAGVPVLAIVVTAGLTLLAARLERGPDEG
jgi:ABC-type phosphate transport system permease subunit